MLLVLSILARLQSRYHTELQDQNNDLCRVIPSSKICACTIQCKLQQGELWRISRAIIYSIFVFANHHTIVTVTIGIKFILGTVDIGLCYLLTKLACVNTNQSQQKTQSPNNVFIGYTLYTFIHHHTPFTYTTCTNTYIYVLAYLCMRVCVRINLCECECTHAHALPEMTV